MTPAARTVPADIDCRVGRFTISRDMLGRAPGAMMAVLEGCIIVRCELMHYRDEFDYVALHAAFEPVERGQMPHEYRANVLQPKPNTYVIEWKRTV